MSEGGQILLGMGGAVVGALATVVTAVITRKPSVRTSDAEFQASLNAGFAALAERYDAANRALVERVQGLEAAVLALDGHIITLEAVLRENHLPVPPRAPAPVLRLVE